MPRESLGQFRLYRFICDVDGNVAETQVKGSRRAELPEGWLRISYSIGVGTDSQYAADDAITHGDGLVCSFKCGHAFIDGTRLAKPQDVTADA